MPPAPGAERISYGPRRGCSVTTEGVRIISVRLRTLAGIGERIRDYLEDQQVPREAPGSRRSRLPAVAGHFDRHRHRKPLKSTMSLVTVARATARRVSSRDQ